MARSTSLANNTDGNLSQPYYALDFMPHAAAHFWYDLKAWISATSPPPSHIFMLIATIGRP
jgi:hypothetical protein